MITMEKEITETTKRLLDTESLLDEDITIHKKLLPETYLKEYQKWFATCEGLLEVNANKEKINEFNGIYSGIAALHTGSYITKTNQISLVEHINRQFHIVSSLPDYLNGKSHSLRMTIASMLMGDELKESRLLLENGFTRAAGAIAGVVLERHLKLRLDESTPKIRYGKKVMLGQLIKKAEVHNLFDNSTIQKLKYLNEVRIKCDHDKKSEPTELEVNDLIDQTYRFVHFIDK